MSEANSVIEVTAADLTLSDKPEANIETSNEHTNEDYTLARNNLHTILEKGTKALDQLTNIADQSQHPRAYEVLATLIKNLGDVNDKLMNLQRDVRDLEAQEAEVPEENTGDTHIHVANGGIFVGTTADLLDKAKKDIQKIK